MRRRRSSIAVDSLELLLDTITNTFGGILLLALMLVLLVRDSPATNGEASGESSAAEKLVLAERIEQLSVQRDILKQSMVAQELFHSGADNVQSQQLMQQLSQLLKQIGVTRTDQLAQEAMHQQLENQIKVQSALLAKLTADLTQRQSEVKAADAELQKEQARRTQTMDLPMEQVTRKRMAVVVVKANQLYLVQTNPGFGEFKYNTDHFQESTLLAADVVLSDQTCLSVKPDQGVAMTATELAKGLSGLSPKDVYLTIAIADDSFGTFAELRSTCVQMGLEYKIFPVSDFPIVEGRTSQLPRAQ